MCKICWITVIIFLVSLTGCKGRYESKGLFLSDRENLVAALLGTQVHEKLERGSEGIQMFDSRGSQVVQNEQILSFLSRHKTDQIIVYPVDVVSVSPLISLAEKRNLSLIFFGDEPSGEDLSQWKNSFYVGVRPDQPGSLQAIMVADLIKGDDIDQYDKNGDGMIQTVILMGNPEDRDAKTRTFGFLDTSRNLRLPLDLLGIIPAQWSENIAYEKMVEIGLTHSEQIELVVANNDDMAIGAIRKLRQDGFFSDTNGNGHIDRFDADWTPVLGIGGTVKAILRVDSGIMYGTVIIPYELIAQSVDEVSRLLSRKGGDDILRNSEDLADGHYYWINCIAYYLREKPDL